RKDHCLDRYGRGVRFIFWRVIVALESQSFFPSQRYQHGSVCYGSWKKDDGLGAPWCLVAPP
ncbi:unnamed protein product, partial [Amoebophrya sp. A120]